MKIKTIFALGTLLLIQGITRAQTPAVAEHRQLAAKRSTQPIKIDGNLDEAVWKDAPLMTGYKELRPMPGRSEFAASTTESWLLYDDEGIYFGGFCHEKTK